MAARLAPHAEAFVALAYALLCTFLLWHLHTHPSSVGSSDASAYLSHALNFRAHGFLSDFGNIRTYGYPLLLSLLASVGTEPATLALGAGIVQAVLYGLAVAWLAWLVAPENRRVKFAVLAGLLLNPFLASIVVDTLSDGISLTAYVAAGCIILHGHGSRTPLRLAGWMTAAAALASFAIMVRPANLVLGFALFTAFAVLAAQQSRARFALLGLLTFVFIIAALVFWSPQYWYNVRSFGLHGVFTACPVGDLQLAYGIVLLKYDTVIRDGAAFPFYIRNPWFEGRSLPAGEYWRWYAHNPAAGLATVSGHLFASFDIDHLFVYADGGAARRSPLISFAAWVWIISGFAVLAGLLRRWWAQPVCRLPVALELFLALSFCLTVAINMFAAVETRMSLMPVALLCVAALYGALGVEAGRLREVARKGVPILCLALVALYASSKMRALGTSELALAREDMERLSFHCFHQKSPA